MRRERGWGLYFITGRDVVRMLLVADRISPIDATPISILFPLTM